MVEIADGWREIENGYQKGDSGPRITIDPSHVEMSEHGGRVRTPVESPNAYTVSAWHGGSHDDLVHFERMLDAIEFAKLVTHYVEERPLPGALRDLAKGMAGEFETGKRPTGIVSDRDPGDVLEMMLGSDSYHLDQVLSDE